MSDECRAYAAECLRVAKKVTGVKTTATSLVDFQAHCSAISPTNYKSRFFESHGGNCFCWQLDLRQRIVMRSRYCALLGGMEMAMEAFSCPMCLRALKISTIEPHPTRDRVDVVTYGCPIHGDIWRSVIVNRVAAADTEIAALLQP